MIAFVFTGAGKAGALRHHRARARYTRLRLATATAAIVGEPCVERVAAALHGIVEKRGSTQGNRRRARRRRDDRSLAPRSPDCAGPNAILEASESISALRRLIATLGPEQSGKVFNHTSRKYPWGFIAESNEPRPPSLRLEVRRNSPTRGVDMFPTNLRLRSVRDASRHTDQVPLFFQSLSWERTVRSVLERVERLPTNVQGEIATCVGKYIHFAGAATDHASLTGLIEAAAGERAKVAQKSTVDPRWSALALAEAWCVSRLGLFNGNMNRLSAMSVITAIEAFAFAKYPDDQIRGQVMLQMSHTGQASQIGSAAQQ